MGSLTASSLAQAVFALFALYHLLVGVPAILSVKVIRWLGAKIYALEIPENLDPKYEYNLKPLGFYAVTLGLLCTLELSVEDPRHRSAFLLILAFLLMMRAGGRAVYRGLVERAFGISWKRSRGNVVFNLALATALVALALAL